MKVKALDALDLIKTRATGRQMVKTIKIREDTYNIIRDMKKSDPNLKSLDDVIVQCIAITALHAAETN